MTQGQLHQHQKGYTTNVTKAVVRKSILMQITKSQRQMDTIRQRNRITTSMSIANATDSGSGLILNFNAITVIALR
jgi:hypothetical protein